MHSHTRRHRTLSVLALASAGLLAGCGSDSATSAAGSTSSAPGTPSTATTTTTTTTTTTSTTTTGTGTPGGTGCARTTGTAPAGAVRAPTADLDLDGSPDTLWLADHTDAGGALVRELGVTTAGGATFSTTYSSAAPQAATAIGQRLQPAGPAVVLLNTGRSVALYAVVDCALVPTRNPQGGQYTFDLGFTGYGTGVGCVAGGDEEDLSLVGLNARATDDAGTRFTVTQTAVELSDAGRQARNGATTTVVSDVPADNPHVVNAHTVGCGNQTTGPVEPQ